MICPICKTKNNYYVKKCKVCGCTLDTKQTDEQIDNTVSNEKPVFLYQTKEEKEIKQKASKKGIVFLSIVALSIIVMVVIGWKNEGEKIVTNPILNKTEQNTEIEKEIIDENETQLLNKQETVVQNKKKQN